MKPTNADLLKLATWVIKHLEVDVQAADTCIRLDPDAGDLCVDLVLGEILKQTPEMFEDDGDVRIWSQDQRVYARGCLESLQTFLKRIQITTLYWHCCHSPDCGTKYRDCAPDCPKDVWERTGVWTGPEELKPGEEWSLEGD